MNYKIIQALLISINRFTRVYQALWRWGWAEKDKHRHPFPEGEGEGGSTHAVKSAHHMTAGEGEKTNIVVGSSRPW